MLKGILLSSFVPPSPLKIGFPSSSSNLARPGSLAHACFPPRKKDSHTGFCKTQGWMNYLTQRNQNCKKKRVRLKWAMEIFRNHGMGAE